jgi:hypothetical protein
MILIANDCGRDGIKSIKYDSDTGEMERLYFKLKSLYESPLYLPYSSPVYYNTGTKEMQPPYTVTCTGV